MQTAISAITDTGGKGGLTEQGLVRLEKRVRYLEERLARYESEATVPICDLLAGPQRKLSPEDMQSEVQRLLGVSAEKGVEAILPDVCTCRELLESLAEACYRGGMTSEGQYLDYLANPCD